MELVCLRPEMNWKNVTLSLSDLHKTQWNIGLFTFEMKPISKHTYYCTCSSVGEEEEEEEIEMVMISILIKLLKS